ncbi:MAG: transposase [Gillisia sp.]
MEKSKEKRIFSLEVKLDLVKKIEQGDLRVLDVSRIYGVSKTAVYKWLKKYSDLYKKQTRVIVEHKSISKKNKELQEQVKKLEQALGQKQMRIDYLEKVVEFASERSGEDIEKKNKRLS